MTYGELWREMLNIPESHWQSGVISLLHGHNVALMHRIVLTTTVTPTGKRYGMIVTPYLGFNLSYIPQSMAEFMDRLEWVLRRNSFAHGHDVHMPTECGAGLVVAVDFSDTNVLIVSER
jgi:hypothetical protein